MHVLVPGLLPPPDHVAEWLAGLVLPGLAALLGHLPRRSANREGYEAALCQALGIARQRDWPIAPLTLAADGGTAGEVYWLRADPVHLRANRDHLVLADASLFAISAEQARALAATLNGYFAADGFAFEPLTPQRWYLRLASAPELATTPLYEAAGRSVDPRLPAGRDATRFHALLNEAQMALHEHPVNQAREARGELVVNSVWLWGGGRYAQAHPAVRLSVHADEPLARTLAEQTGHGVRPLPAGALALAPGDSATSLVVLDALRAPCAYADVRAWRDALARLDRDWFAPLARARRSLTLTGSGEAGTLALQLAPAPRWQFWRKPTAISEALSR